MARARNIKPQFFKDADLSEVSRSARLLFVGLWTLADCEGRMADDARWIKVEIFPYDGDMPSAEVEALLCELATANGSRGFITRYCAGNRKYIQINAFKKHQNPHLNERTKGSLIPAPQSVEVASTTEPLGTNPEQYGTDPDVLLNPSSLNPGSLFPAAAICVGEPKQTETPGPKRIPLKSLRWDEAEDSPIAFRLFRESAERAGVAGSSTDWSLAEAMYGKLDPDQKLASIAGMSKRTGSDDPVCKSLPQNIVGFRKWERPIREPPENTSRGGSVREAALALAKKKDLEKAERLKCR
jgi:hypothetical protein